MADHKIYIFAGRQKVAEGKGLVLPSDKPGAINSKPWGDANADPMQQMQNALDDFKLREKMQVPEIKFATIEDTHEWEVEMKISKCRLRRLRQMAMGKKPRLPRKLKKAYRHMVLYNKDTIVDTSSLKSVNITIELGYWIGTQNNYPHTKWVRKAYCQVYKTYKRFNELLVKEMLSESLPHRSPEMVITKEQQGVLQQMIKSSIH